MKQDGFDLVTCPSAVTRSTNWVSDVNESLPVTWRDSVTGWRQNSVRRQCNHRLSISNSHHHKRGANVNGDVTSERSQDDTWGASNDDMCDTGNQQHYLISRLKPSRPGDVPDGELLDESKEHLREVHDEHGIRCWHGKRSVSEKLTPVMTEIRW